MTTAEFWTLLAGYRGSDLDFVARQFDVHRIPFEAEELFNVRFLEQVFISEQLFGFVQLQLPQKPQPTALTQPGTQK